MLAKPNTLQGSLLAAWRLACHGPDWPGTSPRTGADWGAAPYWATAGKRLLVKKSAFLFDNDLGEKRGLQPEQLPCPEEFLHPSSSCIVGSRSHLSVHSPVQELGGTGFEGGGLCMGQEKPQHCFLQHQPKKSWRVLGAAWIPHRVFLPSPRVAGAEKGTGRGEVLGRRGQEGRCPERAGGSGIVAQGEEGRECQARGGETGQGFILTQTLWSASHLSLPKSKRKSMAYKTRQSKSQAPPGHAVES